MNNFDIDNKEFMDAVSQSFEKIKPILAKINEITKVVSSFVAELSKTIDSAFLNDEEKEELISLADKYVEKGLVVPLDDSIDNYFTFKLTKKNINYVYNQYSRPKKFKELCGMAYSLKYVDREYVKEAISCYKVKNYLSCSALLMATLDCEFLSVVKNSEGKKQKISKTATEKEIENLKRNKSFASIFFCEIVALKTLGKIYQYGGDFKEEPNYITRNFVMHGVSKRKATKNDCVMLFILCSYIDYIVDACKVVD